MLEYLGLLFISGLSLFLHYKVRSFRNKGDFVKLSKMADYLAKLDAALHDKNCPCTQYLEMIEKKTNVPRKFLVLGKI